MIARLLSSYLDALSLLTRVPLPARARPGPGSLPAYPLVGLTLGAVLAVLAVTLPPVLGSWLSGALVTAGLALLTGGLHLDGLADLFDAAGGGRGDRRRALEIMRDPRVGAHGAAALALLLPTKALALAQCCELLELSGWLLLPTVARGAVVGLLTFSPLARPDGLASTLRPTRATPFWIAAAITAAACGLAPRLWPAVLCAVAVVLAVGAWACSRLGGVNGDVCGAAIELAELGFALAAIASAPR
jgi:adenosylcobinamide-GDP ribazoletransferase